MLNAQMTVSSEKTRAQLRELGLSMKNFPAEFREVGKVAKDYFENDVFETQGRAIGVSWPPRKSSKGSWPLLQKTGTMRHAWDYISDNKSATIFNPVDYARYHQTGTRKMPQRMIMAFAGELPEKIMKRFTDMLEAKIRRALRLG